MPSNSSQPSSPPSNKAALAAFAALLHAYNRAFFPHRPTLLAGCNAVALAGWVLGVDPACGGRTTFGPYVQCDPLSRCVGCEAFCSTEDGVVALSAKTGGRPVLMLERSEPGIGAMPALAIRTFVPGLPGQGGVFRPLLNPVDGEIVLVDVVRNVMASVEPEGHLRFLA